MADAVRRPVVVAGLWIPGSSLLRHLSRLGHPVVGVSHRRDDPGFCCRDGVKHVCPDPDDRHSEWVEFMCALAADAPRRPALFPSADEYVVAIDAAADRLRDRYVFHGFGDGVRARLTSKRFSFRMAAEHGFPMPASRFLEGREELATFADEVAASGADVLIKPEYAASWRSGDAVAVLRGRKVLVGRGADGILPLYDRVAPFTASILAQEVIPGSDDRLIYWGGFVRPDGVVAGRLIGRKERLEPIHFGSASYVTLVDRPGVEAECERFLAAVGYRGLCGIELKEDPRDGIAKLIEVNPRWGLWDDIGVPVGVDTARQAVAALDADGPEELPGPRRPRHFRQKWVAVSRDLSAVRAYRAEGTIGWFEWLGSLRPPIRVGDMTIWRDPPFAWYFIRRLLAAAWRKLGP